MPITSTVITIAATPTLIAGNDDRANTDLLPITLRNDSGVDIYLGGPSVTADASPTTGGLRMATGELIPFELGQSDKLYGRTAGGTAPLQLLRQRT